MSDPMSDHQHADLPEWVVNQREAGGAPGPDEHQPAPEEAAEVDDQPPSD